MFHKIFTIIAVLFITACGPQLRTIEFQVDDKFSDEEYQSIYDGAEMWNNLAKEKGIELDQVIRLTGRFHHDNEFNVEDLLDHKNQIFNVPNDNEFFQKAINNIGMKIECGGITWVEFNDIALVGENARHYVDYKSAMIHTAAHEMGHTLGIFDHVPGNKHTMSAVYHGEKPELTVEDIEAFCRVFYC